MLTYEIIPDALQFHAAFEFRTSQHFSADRIHAHALLVNGYLFCAWIDADNARGETFLELVC
jgi:hypothetical protein